MQFYRPKQYENLTDRLKRLAQTSNTEKYISHDLTAPSSIEINQIIQPDIRNQETKTSTNYSSGRKQERLMTQYPIRSSTRQKREKVDYKFHSKKQTTLEPHSQKNKGLDDESTQNLQPIDLSLAGTMDDMTLGRAKSQSFLKVEELLNNYRQYKHSKQVNIQSMPSATKVSSQEAKGAITSQKRPNSRINFEEITTRINLNERPSSSSKRRVEQTIRSHAQRAQHSNRLLHEKSLSRIRVQPPNTHDTLSTLTNMMLSPRTNRIPGKICRNREMVGRIAR